MFITSVNNTGLPEINESKDKIYTQNAKLNTCSTRGAPNFPESRLNKTTNFLSFSESVFPRSIPIPQSMFIIVTNAHCKL